VSAERPCTGYDAPTSRGFVLSGSREWAATRLATLGVIEVHEVPLMLGHLGERSRGPRYILWLCDDCSATLGVPTGEMPTGDGGGDLPCLSE